MAGLALGLLGLLASQGSDPYSASAPLAIRGVTPEAATPRLGEPTNLRLDLSARYTNPYDPALIRVDARVETPSGKSYLHPAYLTRDFSPTTAKKEPPYWNLRLTLNEPGLHRITVTATDVTGTVVAKTIALTPVEGNPLGFVRVSERDHRYFETDRGLAYWPIGTNGPLPPDAPGINLVRIPLDLESPGVGYGRFSPESAWELDARLSALRSRGQRALITLYSGTSLLDGPGGSWATSGLNRRNGGPLDYPTDFWNSPAVEKGTAALLRYVVARYSADPAVFAWELWDEVDRVSDFARDRARAWHSRTAATLRSLDSFYRHPITTSVANPAGVKELELLPELDFLQTHANADDPVGPVVVQGSRKGGWGKPHLPSRIGYGEGTDVRSVGTRDPMWAALATLSCGASIPAIQPNPGDLPSISAPLGRFVQGIDFPREAFRPTRPTFGYLYPAGSKAPPGLNSWAIVGERTVVIWMRNSLGILSRLRKGLEEGTVPPTFCRLEGLASGTYDVQLWDTTKTEPASVLTRTVPVSGVLTIPLPAIGHDLAVKAILRENK